MDRRGEVHAGIWWGNLNETYHLEDLAIDGITILKGIFQEIGLEGGIDWTLLTQDRDRWHNVMNAAVNRQVP
jgi:hypothetical protein